MSSSREIRGRIADQANKSIRHFYGLGAHLSASNFSGAALCRHGPHRPQRRLCHGGPAAVGPRPPAPPSSMRNAISRGAFSPATALMWSMPEPVRRPIARLIGHLFTYASQVHTLTVQQTVQFRRLRLGWRQHTAWCGSEVSRNWCPRSDGRVWRYHGLRSHGGLFDAHDLHPARTDETMTTPKLQLCLQSDQRYTLARL
jgi:hypothetical protein